MLKLAEGQSYTIGFSGILAPHESDRIVFQKTGGSCSGARNLWDFEDDRQLVTNARVAVPPTLDAGYHILCRCASEELRLSCATADLFWNELPGVALLVSHVPPPGPRPAQPPVTALEGHVEGHEEAESTLHALVATLSATLAVVLLLVFAVLHRRRLRRKRKTRARLPTHRALAKEYDCFLSCALLPRPLASSHALTCLWPASQIVSHPTRSL